MAPPLLGGADQDTSAALSAAATATPLGTPGTVAGTTAADGLDGALVPMLFVPVTVNV